MPHFDEFGDDEWICQVCGKVLNSKIKSEWREDITGIKGAGNTCPDCVKKHDIYQPTYKAPEINELLTQTTGISRQDAATQKICTFCKGDASEFRNDISRREYRISGLCQKCQDSVFGKD